MHAREPRIARRVEAFARDFLAAWRLLTAFPGSAPETASAEFARAAVFFPVVGLGIGLGLWVFAQALDGNIPRGANTVALLVFWEALRSAKGPRAVGRTLAPQGTAAHAAGALVCATLVAKGAAMHACTRTLPFALLFAPVLSFWSLVVLATGARDGARRGRKFNAGITFREFGLTSTFSLAVVFLFAEALGFVVAVPVAALILLLRLLGHRRDKGVSWDSLQASAQGVEIAVLVLLGLW